VFSVFTGRCSEVASNGGRSPSSGFPNCSRPQLPASHFTQPTRQWTSLLPGSRPRRLAAISHHSPTLLTAVSRLSRNGSWSTLYSPSTDSKTSVSSIIACSLVAGGENMSTELFSGNGCCTVACLHSCYLGVGLYITVCFSGKPVIVALRGYLKLKRHHLCDKVTVMVQYKVVTQPASRALPALVAVDAADSAVGRSTGISLTIVTCH
jgi:hypothetical protein